ncbi:hypothetical protein Cgig2_007899 [Carnegiea gigantea]|uniref:AP2/ERF domain-containing protein n=1 Tax=Carnegiea gigantea TaxID=171969 RepID=A0A9Q1KDD6_9CARY|nr:hypothetical protein Cgig2_007899 [Carnegiea gigantea]
MSQLEEHGGEEGGEDAIQEYCQSWVKRLFSDLDGEEVGVEVEYKSQNPSPHHYHSMDEQFSLYGSWQDLYFFDQRGSLFSSIIKEWREEVHPLDEGVRKSMWRPGEWEARVRGRNGRSRLCLGTFHTPDDAARAHDRAAFRFWGRRARLNFCEFGAPGHPSPAAHVSGCSASPEQIIKDDHITIQIHQLEDQETIPTATHEVRGHWAQTIATFRKKAMNTINRSTQGIPNELHVGLIGLTYQFMSMPWSNGRTRYILTVANALGFSFLLIGMVRRARKCRFANLLLFMGTLFSSGGILFSMSRDVHGLLGWFVPMACLFILVTAAVF